METLRKIIKSAFIVFFGIIFAKLIGYLFRIIVARTDTELYGIYSLAFAIISFVMSFTVLSLNQGIIRWVSYYKGTREKEKSDIVISTALKIVFSTSLLFFFIFFFFSDFISSFFNIAGMSVMLRFFAFLIPIMSFSIIFGSVLVANKNIVHLTLSKTITEPVLRLSAVIILFFFGFKLFGIVFGFLISNIIVLALLVFFSRRYFRFNLKGFDKGLILFSMPILLISIISGIIKNIDTIMLGYFTNIEEVALYNSALPTAALLLVFSTSLMAIFLPTITEKYARKEDIGLEYAAVTKWVFMLTLPFALIMIFFSNKLLAVLFGNEYHSAGIALSILCFSYFFSAISQSSRNVLLMLKKTKMILYYVLAAFAINLVLNLVLIPLFDKSCGHGMYGAAIATGLSFFALSVFSMKSALGYAKIRIFDKNHLKILLAALISAAITYSIQRVASITQIWQLLILLSGFMLVYIILIFSFSALDKQDKLVLKAIKNKSISKISIWFKDY